jgi:carboxylesterase
LISADAFELGSVGGEGPALLCLHGLTGTPYEVRPPAAIFEQHGFACLGPMLPGHGCSVEELARTPRDAWVRCACDTYDRLAATHSRVYVLGLSLGGVLALKVAAERPVAGALVIAAPLDLGPIRRLAVPLLSLALASLAKTPAIFDDESRARHPGYRRMPLRAVLELIRLQSEVEAQLPRITAPLRLLYSRRDPTVRVDDAARILRGASHAQGTIDYLESSSHVVTVDRERERVEQWIVNSILELEKTHELTERTSRL